MSYEKKIREKLTAEQKSSLKKGYQTGKSHSFRKKCQCILLRYEGKTVNELSIMYGVGKNTIYIWLNLWKTEGINGLYTKPGQGRPPKINLNNRHHTTIIKTMVENEPKNLNRVVGQIKSKLGIEVSKKTLIRFLKNLNTHGKDFVND